MKDLFYELSTKRFFKKHHGYVSSKQLNRKNPRPFWKMKDGTRIVIADMDSKHLRNAINMYENKYEYVEDLFNRVFSINQENEMNNIYTLNFGTKNNSKKFDFISKYFSYFFLKREEIYRMKQLEYIMRAKFNASSKT